jgi:hypothetical protein
MTMRHFLIIGAGTLAIALLGLTENTSAQTRRPYDDYTPPPSVSPYMNLMNNNSDTTTGVFMNYQLLVKPQLEQRKFNKQSTAALREVQQQQQQITRSRSQSGGDKNSKLRPTGHIATRANYMHYYPALNRQQVQ